MIYFFVGTLILLGLVLTAYNALNNATIRGLQNTVKMKDERIEVLKKELDVKLIDDRIYIGKAIKHYDMIMMISDIDRCCDAVSVRYEIIKQI